MIGGKYNMHVQVSANSLTLLDTSVKIDMSLFGFI